MNRLKRVTLPALVITTGLGLSACNTEDEHKVYTEAQPTIETTQTDEATSTDSASTLITSQPTSSTGQLDKAEATHLIFMREEEKLARDVYLTLNGMWPDSPIFQEIGEDSEQTHTDVIRDKLADYGIPDPNPDTNNLPSSIGVYTGEEFGAYFQEKYMLLVNKGSQSELDALYVGAFIEELDMHDLVECPEVIEEADNGITDCGLNYTDEPALISTISSLLDGSKNHLRAFVGRIESVIGEGNYEAQVISQEEVDEILGR